MARCNPILALLLALAISGLACRRSPAVLVTVSAIPVGATLLAIEARLDEREARPLKAFDLAPFAGRDNVSFVLDLPPGATGQLRVTLRALNSRSCLLGQGSAEGPVERRELPVALAPVSGPCVDIASVEPPFAFPDSRARVTLRGRGFQPGAVVTVAGRPTTGTVTVSDVELATDLPDVKGQRIYGPVMVRVENPDATFIERGNLFRFRYRTGFVLAGQYGPFSASRISSHLRVADLNGDGAPDVVTSGPAVLWNVHDGETGAYGKFVRERIAEPLGLPNFELDIADIDGDGRPDIVASGADGGKQVAVLRNRGGRFPLADRTMVRCPGGRIVIGDVNRDGIPDVFMSAGNGALDAFLSGRFEVPPVGCGVRLAVGTTADSISNLALGDLDGDGHPDLVVAIGNPAEKVVALRNLGDGSFPPVPATIGSFSGSPIGLGLGDVNNDGKTDMVAAISEEGTVRVMINQGDGLRFGCCRAYRVGAAPRGLVLVDLNGDGRLDVAVANRTTGTISVLAQSSDAIGGFPEDGDVLHHIKVSAFPLDVAAADFNLDGAMDLAVAHGYLDGEAPGVTVLLATPDENVIE